jgi:putative hydrolase of the HAD superfamily
MEIKPDKVEALLYDFGGVIIEISFDRVFARWAELSGLPFEHVKSHFRHGDAYNAHEKGQLDTRGFYDALRRDIGFGLDDSQIRDGWMQVLGDEIAPTVANIARLHGRMPQFLFSNTNTEHYEVWGPKHARALAPMGKQFISCFMGVRKPDAEAFEAVSRDLGVPLDRILFFDDTQRNIDGARAVGMQAVLVRSPDDVAGALRPWL